MFELLVGFIRHCGSRNSFCKTKKIAKLFLFAPDYIICLYKLLCTSEVFFFLNDMNLLKLLSFVYYCGFFRHSSVFRHGILTVFHLVMRLVTLATFLAACIQCLHHRTKFCLSWTQIVNPKVANGFEAWNFYLQYSQPLLNFEVMFLLGFHWLGRECVYLQHFYSSDVKMW